MTMSLDPTAERLLAEIARKTGQGATEILTAALTAHARATGIGPHSLGRNEDRFNAMLAVAKRAAQRPVFDPRPPEEIVGYDALGLPE